MMSLAMSKEVKGVLVMIKLELVQDGESTDQLGLGSIIGTINNTYLNPEASLLILEGENS